MMRRREDYRIQRFLSITEIRTKYFGLDDGEVSKTVYEHISRNCKLNVNGKCKTGKVCSDFNCYPTLRKIAARQKDWKDENVIFQEGCAQGLTNNEIFDAGRDENA